jgi:hypothetical protein
LGLTNCPINLLHSKLLLCFEDCYASVLRQKLCGQFRWTH